MTRQKPDSSTHWSHAIAAALLAGLLLLNIYRAVTQSFVHDEAQTYHLYLRSSWRTMFAVYDANHHFLSTLLVRLSTSLFGFSELAMRLPTLVAGAWYFVIVFRLARLALDRGWRFLLAIVLAAANPLVLDFLVAARGYGLAMALLAFGIYRIVGYLSVGSRGRSALCEAGISLALAVSANVTLLVPVMVAGALLLAVLWKQQDSRWPYFLTTLCAVLLLFYAISPIHQATQANFYYGAHSLIESFEDLAALSLAHNPGPFHWNRLLGWMGWWRHFAIFACAAACLGAMAVAVRTWNWLLLFASFMVAGSWAILFVAHHVTGLLYPLDRTGLYFLPLIGLLFPCLSAAIREHPVPSRLCAVIGAVIACQYLLQPNTSRFYIWTFDADTKSVVDFLDAGHPVSARLGTSWPLDPALNYYRDRRKITWFAPLTRTGPDGQFDYYLLMEADQDRVVRNQLKVLYRGPISGTVVATRLFSVPDGPRAH
ncbi:MAG TPA: glycosyltransferase family 39 protein [Bryobacteraceae bacterium]|nr:glycosyltransferase family 39 protein [Bryobacteraceae bacterium]